MDQYAEKGNNMSYTIAIVSPEQTVGKFGKILKRNEI